MPAERLWSDVRVVVDGKLIASQAAGAAMEFAYAIVRELLGNEKVREVDAGVLAPVGEPEF